MGSEMCIRDRSKEASLTLQPGMHAIQVNWFEKSGDEVLALDWAGPGIKSGGIDKAIVMTADGAPIVVEVETEEADPEKFVYDSSLVERGRELYASLGCAASHVTVSYTHQTLPTKTIV